VKDNIVQTVSASKINNEKITSLNKEKNMVWSLEHGMYEKL
jgi:hypothetical protein